MSSGFVKIYGDLLLGSSLMEEAVETRWLFMCFAAKADSEGFVRCQTVGNAARLANISEEAAAKALEALSSPDAHSTTPADEGRRLKRVEGGWTVINHSKYREMRTEKQLKEAERLRDYRSRTRTHRTSTNAGSTATYEKDLPLNQSSVSVGERGTGGGAAPATLQRSNAPANPLVADRRVQMEREVLAMVKETAALTGEDPVEVIARASGYKGAATTKLNPATMSDDRLANTWRDLRDDLAELRKRKAVANG